MTDDEFETFAAAALADVESRQYRIAEVLLFDDQPFDPRRGTIRFDGGGDAFVEARVLPVGRWAPESGRWTWAQSPSMAKPLAALAAATGRAEFSTSSWDSVNDTRAARFTALVCQRVDGLGYYRQSGEGVADYFVVLENKALQSEAILRAVARQSVERSLLGAQGAGLLNLMRRRFAQLRINLAGADLRGAPLDWDGDLHMQVLVDTDRLATHETRDLSTADLSMSRLDGTNLRGVALRGAVFDNASLIDADLSGADLRGASLRSAFLNGANLTRAKLAGADFTGAELSRTLLTAVDLSQVVGLDDVHHMAPSEISFSTLIESGFKIDPAFLRKAGVSRGLIEDLMRGKKLGNAYETCFLSYSSKDREFAGQLYESLIQAGVRVFWDQFDLLPGEFLETQIAEAIREHQRLLLILSPDSMASDWVAREVQIAWYHKPESLFPIRLCPIEDVKAWTARADGVPDLANRFPIQDFSSWRDPAAFQHALSLVLTAFAGGVDLTVDDPACAHPEY